MKINCLNKNREEREIKHIKLCGSVVYLYLWERTTINLLYEKLRLQQCINTLTLPNTKLQYKKSLFIVNKGVGIKT